MKKQWEIEIKEILESNPLTKEASWFKTHYLNEWCSDDELLIVRLTNGRNYQDSLPDGDWFYCLGVDLGYNDDSSFSVIAYSPSYPTCFVVDAYKDTRMDFTDVANQIKQIQRKYPIVKIIIDGANKQGVEEIKRRHNIPMEPAEKSDKATYLRLLRDDALQAKVKLISGMANELVTEWAALQWKDTNKDKEDDRCQNHLSDATLYAWRWARHYTYQPPAVPEDKDSDEYMDKQEEREAEDLREELEEKEWWEQKIAA